MKIFVVLVLAVCLPALYAYECNSCDLDGSWRVADNSKINNDDELFAQMFDGQVEWREEYSQFTSDYNAWVSANKPSGSLQDQARQSCKEAIPDRVYQFRWEREIDDDEYEVRQYLYRGFEPASNAWDRYCRLLVDRDSDNYVESFGRSNPSLKGSVAYITRGNIVPTGGSDCNAELRPKLLSQNCLVKNDALRFPSELFCGQWQAGQSIYTRHAWGGHRTHTRYGCNQYTWDSDSNDDNIEQTCSRMYFVNTYNMQGSLHPGQVPGGDMIYLANPATPSSFCEFRVSNNGWGQFTGLNPHPCQ